jgi:hypothetical protein
MGGRQKHPHDENWGKGKKGKLNEVAESWNED